MFFFALVKENEFIGTRSIYPSLIGIQQDHRRTSGNNRYVPGLCGAKTILLAFFFKVNNMELIRITI